MAQTYAEQLSGEAWSFVCPIDGTPLHPTGPDRVEGADGSVGYARRDGVWDFLPPARAQALGQFMREYEAVRSAENRGAASAAYFNALPYKDTTGVFSADWQIRAQSFDCLNKHVLPASLAGLTIADLGAGNGWLSGRLAQRGAQVAAVDLLLNELDGLGAHKFYAPPFTPIRAEFLGLPFAERSLDVIIFNASLHYVSSYGRLLPKLLPLLRNGGRMVIVDTPFYRNEQSGQTMVAEREAAFLQQMGFASNSQQSESFLTWKRLKRLASEHRFLYQMHWPKRHWRLRYGPLIAKLRGRREPARFPVVVIRPNP